MALMEAAPLPIAMSRMAHAGRCVREATGYPTAPNPIAKAARVGRLKNGEGARDLLGRVCSTPCSIAITASTSPAIKAMRNIIGRIVTRSIERLGSENHASGSQVLPEPAYSRRPCGFRGIHVRAVHTGLVAQESVPCAGIDVIGVRAPQSPKGCVGCGNSCVYARVISGV